MAYKVDNAIIMAAGTASRFAPLSFEKPKALIEVRGEVLIERQIKQLFATGINEIVIIVGYKKEQFDYLIDKYGVKLVENKDYLTRNNNASIYYAKQYLKNTYVCSSDNYFVKNPFEKYVDESYYSAVYAEGHTEEWCIGQDAEGYINAVTIGGNDSWYMLGHTFWSEEFSSKFLKILEQIYDENETQNLLWEGIYMRHLDELKMKIRKYPVDVIFEFDTLDELRLFDNSYVNNSRSQILKQVALELGCTEKDIVDVNARKIRNNEADGFTFKVFQNKYECVYETMEIRDIKHERNY